MYYNPYTLLGLSESASEKEISHALQTLPLIESVTQLCEEVQRSLVNKSELVSRFCSIIMKATAANILNNKARKSDFDLFLADQQKKITSQKKDGKKVSPSSKGNTQGKLEEQSEIQTKTNELRLSEQFRREMWNNIAAVRSIIDSHFLREEVYQEFYLLVCKELEYFFPLLSDRTENRRGLVCDLSFWLAVRRNLYKLFDGAIPVPMNTTPSPQFKKKNDKKKGLADQIEKDAKELYRKLIIRAVSSGNLMLCKELLNITSLSRLDYWATALDKLPYLPDHENQLVNEVSEYSESFKEVAGKLLNSLARFAFKLGSTTVAATTWKMLGLREPYVFLFRDYFCEMFSEGSYDIAVRALVAATDMEMEFAPRFQEVGLKFHRACLFERKACMTSENREIVLEEALSLLCGSESWKSLLDGVPLDKRESIAQALAILRDPDFYTFYEKFTQLALQQRTLMESYDVFNPGFREFPSELLNFQSALRGELAALSKDTTSDSGSSNEIQGEDDRVPLLSNEELAQLNKTQHESPFQILSEIASTHPLIILMVCVANFRDHLFLIPTREDPGFSIERNSEAGKSDQAN